MSTSCICRHGARTKKLMGGVSVITDVTDARRAQAESFAKETLESFVPVQGLVRRLGEAIKVTSE